MLAVVGVAWISILIMAMQQAHHGLSSAHQLQFEVLDILLLQVMWWGMAIAMMLPTAVPALEVLEELNDTAWRKGETAGRPVMFALGFTAVWLAFGVLASVMQYTLHNSALLSPVGKSASAELSAALFVLAGLYQWTPLKQACVSKCRSPMSFFLSCWQEGSRGYLNMGLRMGRYCLGCCWAMMLLMFALGVMNLLWMAILALYMYAEKNWIHKPWFDRLVGLVLVSAGVATLAFPWQ